MQKEITENILITIKSLDEARNKSNIEKQRDEYFLLNNYDIHEISLVSVLEETVKVLL